MRSPVPLTRAYATLLALITMAVTAMAMSSVTPAQAAGPVWADEFDGGAGTAPSAQRWRHDIGGNGWGNNERQYYTDSTGNAALDGQGNLVITARRENPADYQCHYGRCEYTSARLLTLGTFAQQYGRFEARIKIPRGQGLWPAFWMLGADIHSGSPWPASGEIDIMENVGKEPSTVWGSLHGPDRFAGNSRTAPFILPGGQAFADDFHVFAVDWSADRIVWSVDGQTYQTITRAQVGEGNWVFDKPFFLLLNVAVGGVWPGAPDASTSFPQQMLVDYVRVYGQPGVPPTSTPSAVPSATPTPSVTPTSSASAAPSVPVGGSAGAVRGLGGKCLDVAEGRAQPGAAVHVWDCYGSLASQQWTWASDGSVRSLGLCLDTGGQTGDGAGLGLAACSGSSTQQWRLTGAADLVNVGSGRCADVRDANRSNGALVQLWTCAGSENQKWWSDGAASVPNDTSTPTSTPSAVPSATPTPSVSPTSSASAAPSVPVGGSAGAVRGLGGKCLDVAEGRAQPGAAVHVWDCYGSLASQQWTWASDGSVRSLGLCLDTGGQTGDGAGLGLAACSGSSTQQWRLTGAADLVNVGSGRCADVRDANRSNGALVQLWTCAGSENQKWWTAP